MSKKEVIIQLHCAGRTNLKVAKSTFNHVAKRFKELGTSEDRPRSGRPRTARSKKMIKAVQEKVRRNPKKSARQMAKGINVSVASMKRIIENDLKLLPYKMEKYLTPLQKEKKR